jgi:hypothetical protein
MLSSDLAPRPEPRHAFETLLLGLRVRCDGVLESEERRLLE